MWKMKPKRNTARASLKDIAQAPGENTGGRFVWNAVTFRFVGMDDTFYDCIVHLHSWWIVAGCLHTGAANRVQWSLCYITLGLGENSYRPAAGKVSCTLFSLPVQDAGSKSFLQSRVPPRSVATKLRFRNAPAEDGSCTSTSRHSRKRWVARCGSG